MNEIHVQSTGGMKTTGENLSSQKKPVPKTICPPQIPHGLAWD